MALSESQKSHIYRTIVRPLVSDERTSKHLQRVLNTDVGDMSIISNFMDDIYRSSSISCYAELKEILGTTFLSRNKQEIFRYIKEQVALHKNRHKDAVYATRYGGSVNLTNPCLELSLDQKETNMPVNNQTPILDLPIVVKGIDIRDTDVKSLIVLLNKLKEDEAVHEHIGESLYAKKALKKISQARKCVLRELDKREP